MLRMPVIVILLTASALPADADKRLTITPAGKKLAAKLDKMEVEKHWLPKVHVDWKTGKPDGKTGGPPTHWPPAQASAVVQASLSLQGAVLGVVVHPLCGSQPSSVQPVLSLQTTGSLTQRCASHRSFVVQKSESAHCASRLQQPSCDRCTQPVPLSHESAVQASLSSHPAGGPPTQSPPLRQ